MMMSSQEQQAMAWSEVCKVLNEVSPKWWSGEGTGQELAVKAIKKLASPPKKTTYPTLKAMAMNYSDTHSWDNLDAQACLDAATEIQELREALHNTLAQCIGWQGEPNEYSCTVHTAIVNQARKALRSHHA